MQTAATPLVSVRSRAIVVALVVWLLPGEANAYLDPGSGSMLVYALLSMLAALVYALKGLYYRMRDWIAAPFSKDRKLSRRSGNHDIVFFSEGGQYWPTLGPVIRSLLERGHEVTYFTQAENDAGLAVEHERLQAEYIGSGAQGFLRMNRLRAKLVAMTTPQLDIMMLKRSKHVGHYCHIVHAPTDALVYKKFAFDYFDSVCCSGPHQAESIRELEALRQLPQKELPLTGLCYYDVMLEQRPDVPVEPRTVLLAPTWGEHALFARHGLGSIRNLVAGGYRVIVRPHPQTKKSQPKIYEQLVAIAEELDEVELDTAPSGASSMARCSVLISDLSGIIFDTFFVFEKPVVSIEPRFDGRGHEAEDLEKRTWEEGIVEELCTVISGAELPNVAKIVDDAAEAADAERVEKIRSEFVVHFGKAGDATADALERFLVPGGPSVSSPTPTVEATE